MKNNILKVLCLAVGLALGFVLLAKVCFIEECDSCIPDRERIYAILENFRRDKESDLQSFSNTSGGVAPGMAEAIPEIEAATRITGFGQGDAIITEDKREIKAEMEFADSCFFDVFDLPIVCGNPKEILAQNGHAMVSRRLAEALGGVEKAVGMTVVPNSNTEFRITIDGVYETFPENCSFDFDLLVSIECWGEWSLTNWVGNDCYQSFAKFSTVVDKDDIKEKMRKVQEAHINLEELGWTDFELFYTIISLPELLEDDTMLMNMKRLMFFLGLALIVVAVLNYLVIIVSTLVNRVKTIAVYKCYGASFRQLLSMVFRESFTNMLLAIIIGAALVFLIKDTAETLLAAKLSSLFTLKTCLILGAISLGLLTITTFVPAYIFQKVPVAAAFRAQRESKRLWKLGLLFFQFTATTVIIVLLVTITRQYEHIANIDRGYKFERSLWVNTVGIKQSSHDLIMAELAKLPEVEAVTSCWGLPFESSGNNIYLPGDDEQLFNMADMYYVTNRYFDVFEIPVVEGSAFDPKQNNDRTMMVNREFARKMEITAGWTGSIIGRQVCVTEHNGSDNAPFTIIGVFENFRLGKPSNLYLRPMGIFFDNANSLVHPRNIIVKLHKMSPEGIEAVNKSLANTVEERTLMATPFESLISTQLHNERNIRDSLIICALVAMIIAIVGLLGYTTDEVNRRRKEIAIRRVLGTETTGILRLLSKDISMIALPALAIGASIAYYLAQDWLEDYSDKVSLNVWSFLIPTLIIYMVILTTVLSKVYKAANENPARNLKSE